MVETKNFVVNLGRQLGSGGHEIGKKLAERLHIAFYDKELILLASNESGLCKEMFEKADERASSFPLGGLVGGLRFFSLGAGTLMSDNCLDNDALFKVQSDVIRKVAAENSALFVGRCADYILRDHPRCVNLFISASPEARIKRLSEERQITADQARDLIEKADSCRSNYYNFYTFKKWGDAASYHFCIDSSAFGIDATVDLVEELVCKKIGI